MSLNRTTHDATLTSKRTLLILGILFVGTLSLITIGIIVASAPAEARFPINNVTLTDETATLNPSGHNVEVTGTTQCTEGEIVEVTVTVRQDHVEATGQTHERCLGEDTIQNWSIHAATRGSESFNEGNAHVEAEARTYAKGKQTDEHTWSSDIDLVRR